MKTLKRITAAALCLIMLMGTVAFGGSGVADVLDALSVTASATSGSEIVEFAAKYNGTPRKDGGKTPEGFDCSGFVYFVFNHFGITLNASTDWYKTNTTKLTTIEASEADEGDIVVWDGHVGICCGNGECWSVLTSVGVAQHKISDLKGKGSPIRYVRVNALLPEYYTVKSSDGKATVKTNGKEVIATLYVDDLQDEYEVVEVDEDRESFAQHQFTVTFTYGNDKFEIGSMVFGFSGVGKYKLDEFDNWFEIYIDSTHLVPINDSIVSINGNTITWTAEIPESYSYSDSKSGFLFVNEYDASTLSNVEYTVYHYENNSGNSNIFTRIFKPVVSFFKSIVNLFKKLFSRIK